MEQGRRECMIRPHAARPCIWMERDMSEHEEIAKALKARLSELRTHLAKVDRELHKPLSLPIPRTKLLNLRIKKRSKL